MPAEARRGSEIDLVTGAFSYSGARIAELLLDSGRAVRTLTNHPDREHPLQGRVEALPYRFEDSSALVRSLEGVTTLYNTYWVRFERGAATWANALANSKALFEAARQAGVERIVHVSITNASTESPLPYYRAKALAEQALTECDVPHTVVRPTWFFGGRDVVANNIAWVVRHMPVVVVPGDGRYLVQPIHVDDFAEICLRAADGLTDAIIDAVGPDRMEYEQLVRAVRDSVGKKTPVVHAPPAVVAVLSRALGVLVRDVVFTGDEIRGLTAGLQVSHQPALGRISFLQWLHENVSTLGRQYASDLDRHYRVNAVG
jgi:nucleoside-diphosphate-sugar epimerase